MVTIEIWEWLLAPFYILLAVGWTYSVRDVSMRKYFGYGIAARMVGALAFFSIYIFYYGGGDTTAYYLAGKAMTNLLLEDFDKGVEVLFSGYSSELYSYFTSSTGFPPSYIVKDPSTLLVSKLIVPVLLVSFKSYLLGTLVLALLSMSGPWLLFKTLNTMVGNKPIIVAIAVLLFPSTVFWGSGISKDTITYTSLCFVVVTIHSLIAHRRANIGLLAVAVISSYLIFVIKPYIFIALVPPSLLWVFNAQIKKIKNTFLRISVVPIAIVLSIAIFSYVFVALSPYLGSYSVDNIIGKAIVTQEDLTREAYGSNSFNIGTIDPSMAGIMANFPIATFYGFFGPTLLHVNNFVMLFSALENTFLLAIALWIFLLKNPLDTLRRIEATPFLTFCFAFAVLLSFSIGLTTANFGALVRFKIPLVPFFVFLLLTIYNRIDLKTT